MPAFVVGDVHGHRDALVGLLRDAGLVDAAERWAGSDARLWLVGDLFDRGPDGIGALELVMALEREGDVRCLLGNHELMLLAAERFGGERLPAGDLTFAELWLLNGGRVSDLRRLDDEHRAWIRSLPVVGREGDWLLLHADSDRYLELGRSAETVSGAARRILAGNAASEHAWLLEVLSDRGRLTQPDAVNALLATFGGERVVHGHTPIAMVRGADPHSVTAPLVSRDGRVVNVDHCLFAGGPGFVTRLG